MKSILTIISFFLIILLQLAAAASTSIGPLDQRNRPPVTSSAEPPQTNTRVKARSNPRKQYYSDSNLSFNYDILPENISCNIDNESPLSCDVFGAIGALRDGNGHPLRCDFDNTPGDGKNQFCTSMVKYKTAGVSICTTLTGKVDCAGLAEIAVAVSAKCEEEHAGELRVAGMVSMAWGSILVLNSTIQLRAE